jgi:hypothetical protein
MAVHQQNRRAVPAMADPQAHLTDINEVEPETIEHAIVLTSPDRRYFGHLGHLSPRPGPVRKVSMIGPGVDRRRRGRSEGRGGALVGQKQARCPWAGIKVRPRR